MSDHCIIIRHEAFGIGFDVVIDPPLESESLDREWPTHRDAYGYASGLRLARRWPIIDLASDARLGDMLGLVRP